MVYIVTSIPVVIIYQEEDIMFSDIEIAQQAKLRPIQEIAEKAGIISRNPQIVSAVFQDVVDVGSGSDIGDEWKIPGGWIVTV